MQTWYRMQRTQKANPLSSEPAGHKFNSTPARHTQISIFIIVCLFSKHFVVVFIHFVSFHNIYLERYFFFLLQFCVLCSWLLHLLFVYPVHGCPFAAPTALMPFNVAPAIVYAKWVTIVYGLSLSAAHGIKGIPYGLWMLGFNWCGAIMCLQNGPPSMPSFSSIECNKQSVIIFIWNLYVCAGHCCCCRYGSFDFYSFFFDEKKNEKIRSFSKISIASHRHWQWPKSVCFASPSLNGHDDSIFNIVAGRHTTKSWWRWFNVR